DQMAFENAGWIVLGVEVPEDGGEGLLLVIGQPDVGRALVEEVLWFALGGNAREVALDVGGKNRHARSRESFREHLQRHRLSGARGAGDQPVPVGKLEFEELRLAAFANEDLAD